MCVFGIIKSRPLFTELLLCCIIVLISTPNVRSQQKSSNDMRDLQEFATQSQVFGNNVFQKITESRPSDNIVCSPFSIQACAAMARMGADGETAAELDRGLGLSANDIERSSELFGKILSKYENSPILKIANKIYLKNGYSVQANFNRILSQRFFSTAEEIDFNRSEEAAEQINRWVESRTNNLIRDLIPASALDGYTRLVLLNVIYFKGQWDKKFREEETRDADFYLNENDKVSVPMMIQKSGFNYADLRELDATALEMSYKDSDLSMLIILPNSRTGLRSLQDKLKDFSLTDITRRLSNEQVVVKLPKFKVEFDIELTEVFKKLGMNRMFSDSAEFGRMLNQPEALKVSKILHKAFIEVNEEGTEAAAATAITMVRCASFVPISPPINFIVDRPFFFVLKSSEGYNLFSGTVKRF